MIHRQPASPRRTSIQSHQTLCRRLRVTGQRPRPDLKGSNPDIQTQISHRTNLRPQNLWAIALKSFRAVALGFWGRMSLRWDIWRRRYLASKPAKATRALCETLHNHIPETASPETGHGSHRARLCPPRAVTQKYQKVRQNGSPERRYTQDPGIPGSWPGPPKGSRLNHFCPWTCPWLMCGHGELRPKANIRTRAAANKPGELSEKLQFCRRLQRGIF